MKLSDSFANYRLILYNSASMTREAGPLDDPRFQQYLVKHGEKLMGMEKILSHPTVVFDLGFNEFWATVMNGQRKEEVLGKVKIGEIIPVNGAGLTEISQYHSTLHIILADKNLPTVPTMISAPEESGAPFYVLGDSIMGVIPGVVVKKVSHDGEKSLSHKGAGVNIVWARTVEELEKAMPRSAMEYSQLFILPQGDYVRDIRVYMVGGKAVSGLVRRAQKPLTEKNIRGEEIPRRDQIPVSPISINEDLTGDLRDHTFKVAERVAEALVEDVIEGGEPYSPLSPFGYGTIDFLLDSNSNPLTVDFDTTPSVSPFRRIDKELALAMAKYLLQLSTAGGLERNVLLIGNLEHWFESALVNELKKTLRPNQLIVQDNIVNLAFKEFEKVSKKIDRRQALLRGF
jgi:hypothetical protein